MRDLSARTHFRCDSFECRIGAGRCAFEMSARLEELRRAGFWIFGEREVRRLEGGIGSPSPFPISLIRMVRANSPEIIRLGLTSAGVRGGEMSQNDHAVVHRER